MRTLRTLAVMLGLGCTLTAARDVAAQQDNSRSLPSLRMHACRPAVVPTAACFRSDDARRARSPLHVRAADYRYEGLAIGGGIGLVGGVLLGAIACDQSDDSHESCAGDMLKGGLILGGLGGIAGLVVGGFIDKHPHPAPEQPAE